MKVPKKRDVISNFRPMILINAKLKILAMVSAKMFARIMGGLVGEAQNFATPGKSSYE